MASSSTAMLMDSTLREVAWSHQLRNALMLHQEIAAAREVHLAPLPRAISPSPLSFALPT